MKKLIVILIMLQCLNANSQKCDCTIYPFKPDSCVRKCTARILQTADTLEFTLIMGLNSELSSKLDSIRKIEMITDIKDLKESLTPSEYKNIKNAIDRLNEEQIQYFSTPYEKRKTILAGWKNLDLNKRPA